MKVLFFGDIVGRSGREALTKIVPKWKDKYETDLVLANGENLAHGRGVNQKGLEEVLASGVDLVTSGNHIWRNKEVYDLLDDKSVPLLRPANYPAGVPGRGYEVIEVGTKKVLVINLIGRVFIQEDCDDPFKVIDQILEDEADDINHIIVDWHTEATSEKIALGYYLAGRVSAVLGTHTHVPTADAKILEGGTAYISDVGMVGSYDSILGVEKSAVLKRFATQIPQTLRPETEGPVQVNAVLIEIDSKGKSKKIELLQEIVG